MLLCIVVIFIVYNSLQIPRHTGASTLSTMFRDIYLMKGEIFCTHCYMNCSYILYYTTILRDIQVICSMCNSNISRIVFRYQRIVNTHVISATYHCWE